MNVVVTGAHGFIGRRVAAAVRVAGHHVRELTRTSSADSLTAEVRDADAILHLAGVNRPSNPVEFEIQNGELTERIVAARGSAGSPIVAFASSTQVALDNPYGRSKQRAEVALEGWAKAGARIAVFRLPNVFGPGARPNYNSVVATFAHNAARGIPLEVHDASKEVTLVYVHDVAAAFVRVLTAPPTSGIIDMREVAPIYRVTVGELADRFRSYGSARTSLRVPEVSNQLARCLYATYVSHLDVDALGYNLEQRIDPRGTLAEFLKGDAAGQIFVSRTKPGITRGNHFHHTKVEKFLVLEGDAVIRFRAETGTEISEYPVKGTDFRVIDIPPDHTHSIENVGMGELIVLFWASEIFDPAAPDTTALNVFT